MDLETELNHFREECLEVLLLQVRQGRLCAVKEVAETYKNAINAHTVEYLNNRYGLHKNFYRALQK